MTTNNFNNSSKTFKKKLENSTVIDICMTIVIFVVIILIITNPERYTSGTINGLKLFFFKVFPGLFPFMLLTKLLTELGVLFKATTKLDRLSYSLFGTPGVSIYAFLMSIISGYPIGAKIIADLYEKGLISENDAKKMSIFCTTSGPIFVIGTVGSVMFKNYTFGLILYASHIISSLVLGITYHLIYRKRDKLQTTQYRTPIIFTKQKNILSACVTSTINSLFVVGAYITMFYLITELFEALKIFDSIIHILSPLLTKFNIDEGYVKGVLYGILEVTRGAQELSTLPGTMPLILASGVLSFSGLSIIMQSMAFLKDTKIKAHKFVFTKILHALLTIFLSFILVKFFV